MNSLAVILTCHNRVKKTVKSLESLFTQKNVTNVRLDVYLTDDGSADGTRKEVSINFPNVKIIPGDGTLFWNRGMYLAFKKALKDKYDYYLWLNDDTFLYPTCLERLVETHRKLVENGRGVSIVVGSICTPETKELIYGGYVRKNNLFPLSLQLLPPSKAPQPCVTMCGNCVLIPKSVAKIVGNLDPLYEHRWGDVDYGLRTQLLGGEVWIAPGFQGECNANSVSGRWRSRDISLSEKIKLMHDKKGLGKRDWYYYVRKHGGYLWPLMWIKPYCSVLLDSLISSLVKSGIQKSKSETG